MKWLDKILSTDEKDDHARISVPQGVWIKCGGCDMVLYKDELINNLYVCPHCNHHEHISARERLEHFLDPGRQVDLGQHILPVDKLNFKDSRKYSERLKQSLEDSNETDALIAKEGYLHNMPVVCACFEYQFMGGSMGSVVGERFSMAIKRAIELKAGFISIASSGGARMQEGLFSLLQMAKINSALTKLANQSLPYISILTNPTTGGVSASFAFLGDVVVAEPKALIGFAGPRVIESTVRVSLPEGFQRSEFLLAKGAVDFICDRRQLRDKVAEILTILTHQSQLA